MKKAISLIVISFLLSTVNADDHGGGSFVIPKDEVNETLLKGLTNLSEGRTVSDIVVRHVDVGEEYLGVSVVRAARLNQARLKLELPTLISMKFITSSPAKVLWLPAGDLLIPLKQTVICLVQC